MARSTPLHLRPRGNRHHHQSRPRPRSCRTRTNYLTATGIISLSLA
jgi:hypothetical protein